MRPWWETGHAPPPHDESGKRKGATCQMLPRAWTGGKRHLVAGQGALRPRGAGGNPEGVFLALFFLEICPKSKILVFELKPSYALGKISSLTWEKAINTRPPKMQEVAQLCHLIKLIRQ